jgi:hypothetical protein
VIALRRRLYPERDGSTLIGSSVTVPQRLGEVPERIGLRPAVRRRVGIALAQDVRMEDLENAQCTPDRSI